jgi:hypothetical protein
MRNDNKSIISALNDKKRDGQKLTIGGHNSSGINSISKSVQQMIKPVLKSVQMIRNDKSYCHLLSFLLFCAVPYYHLLSKIRPYSVPRVKKCPLKITPNKLIFSCLHFYLLHSAWVNEHSASGKQPVGLSLHLI